MAGIGVGKVVPTREDKEPNAPPLVIPLCNPAGSKRPSTNFIFNYNNNNNYYYYYSLTSMLSATSFFKKFKFIKKPQHTFVNFNQLENLLFANETFA